MGSNLVTIAVDDLFAYDQFRSSFGVTIETPNLDLLMGRSVNFENAYASVAICAPSRAATMSGKTAFETGVHDNFTPLFSVVDPADTWPAMIRDNGYFATASGKVFHSKGGTQGVQEAYSEAITVTKSTLTGERVLTEGGKKWAYLGDDADLADHDVATFGIEFLDRAPADQPFLLTLGFDHPHTAYFAPARYFDLYPIDQITVPETWVQGDLSDVPAFAQQFASQPRGGEPYADLDEWKATVQGYLAAISHMDAQLGRFLDALEASDHADDTAILLYSDHGYQLGAKDHPVKFTLWEESAKAPLMLYMPGQDAKTVTTPVSLMDIMPTVLEITGTAIPDDLVGQSLLSFVTGSGEDYVAKPALTSMYGSFAIRSGDFRYIRYQDGSEELYDLTVDPGQITNLALDPAHAATLARLEGELLTAAREQGALIDPDVARLLGTDGVDQGVASAGNAEIALGKGDDAYFVHGTETAVVERAGEGYDTVYYIGRDTYRLPENVERAYATLPDNRVDAVSIIGNDGDNELHTGYIRGIFYGGDGHDRLFGGGWVSHELHGDAGNDSVVGSKQADLLTGGTGDDTVQGWNKADQIFGGDGRDLIFGGNDGDLVEGGAGDDTLFGDGGADLVQGGAGDDTLSGGDGNDRLEGGVGDDTLYDGAGGDSLLGGAGNDLLVSQGGDDHLFDDAGNDTFVIEAASGHRVVALSDQDGPDRIQVLDLALTDLMLIRIGDALLVSAGTDWSVWIDGAAGSSSTEVDLSDGGVTLGALLAMADANAGLAPGFGDETITGTSLDDWFLGHVGDDTYAAKSGDDLLYGGDGDDALNGANNDDALFGGRGQDMLLGGNGADSLDGGAGDDALIGGAGGDTYVYRLGDGTDVIDDKGFGAGDRLILDGFSVVDVGFQLDGQTLTIGAADHMLRIISQAQDRGQIETFQFDDTVLSAADVLQRAQAPDSPPPPAPLDPAPGSLDGAIIVGTPAGERLRGTDRGDLLRDGAGRDNLFGGAGADIFAMDADGQADSIKDFEIGQDVIDLASWGVTGIASLSLTASKGRISVRYQSELLTVADTSRSLEDGDLTTDSFVFAASSDVDQPPTVILGAAGNDKLYGTAGDDVLVDGAGRDNLFGRAGTDTFTFAADSVPDAVKDFDPLADRLDLSAWGIVSVDQIAISDNGAGKIVVRFQDEVVSLANVQRGLIADDLSMDALVF